MMESTKASRVMTGRTTPSTPEVDHARGGALVGIIVADIVLRSPDKNDRGRRLRAGDGCQLWHKRGSINNWRLVKDRRLVNHRSLIHDRRLIDHRSGVNQHRGGGINGASRHKDILGEKRSGMQDC